MTRDFVWHGKERKADLERALKTAIDETTKAIAEKAEARVRRRTGDLAQSIDTMPAEATREGVEGSVFAGEFYAHV